MRALAVYGELSGASTLAGRDIARQLGDIGLVEFRLGGTRFSQLYASLSLRSYGVDLSTNRIWQSLTPEERTQWATLLDATKFYDPVKQQVINLPENYLGVAARIAAMSFEMGFLKDRALLDGLLDRAAVQFTVRGALRGRRLAHRPLRSLLQRVRPIHLGRGADCRTQGPARRAEADAEDADEAVVGPRRG
jgi:hypothetical protein